METVKKKISLDSFYSRQKSTIPFAGMELSHICQHCGEEYEGEITGATWTCTACGEDNTTMANSYPGLNWGRVAYGVDFTKMGDEDVRKYGNGIRWLGKMTFQELMKEYHRVKNNEVLYEELEDVEVEKLRSIVAFVDDKKVIDEPTPPTDPCCDPCGIPSPVPTEEMELPFDPYVEPIAAVDLCLVQNANIIGAYTFATKDWVQGKRYFSGDKVIYDGKTFKLKEFDDTVLLSGSTTNCQGLPCMTAGFYVEDEISAFTKYDNVYNGLSEALFKEFIVSRESEIVDMGYIYAKMPKEDGSGYTYYVRPSWGGYNNIYDGNLYFDTLLTPYEPERGFHMIGDYETDHWAVDDVIVSHGVYKVSQCEDGISIETEQNRDIGFGTNVMTGLNWESKLVNFKRNQKSVDVNGVELPGRFNGKEFTTLDLQYLIGTVKNVDTTGEVPIGDYLADIQVIPDRQGLISIYHEEEKQEENTGRTRSGTTYTYTSYTYNITTRWELNPDELDEFIGSIEKDGNSFIIYNEWSEEIFVSPRDIVDNEYLIYISIGGTPIIDYEIDDGDTIIDEERVKLTPGKRTRQGFNVVGIKDGGTSCNGEGFTIQPTGSTISNYYDIIADKLLLDYPDCSGCPYPDRIILQDLETYEKLVKNWASSGDTLDGGERGTIKFKYFIGAELELEKNEEGEVEEDAPYIYNGGERRIIYMDSYRYVARYDTAQMYNEDDEVITREYVYLDIDYSSKERTITYENLYGFEAPAIISDITASTSTMLEGGEPVSTDFQNADYIMEDYQLGISFVSNNNDNVYVDRGNATAFERHMRLSEVDTMEDLENMGNGMFRMKE